MLLIVTYFTTYSPDMSIGEVKCLLKPLNTKKATQSQNPQPSISVSRDHCEDLAPPLMDITNSMF